MTKILSHYKITEKTLSLQPAAHIEYQTIVEEEQQIYYVKQTPLQIIKEAVLHGGATYNGRREAISYLTGIQKKIPIPIEPNKQIYAFPTLSPTQNDCCWIFFHHVDAIRSYKLPNDKSYRSIILFKNGTKLNMKESAFTLEKQMYRTWLCVKALCGEESGNRQTSSTY